MLSPPTMDQLQALKLHARAAAWTAQQQETGVTQLGCAERFARLGQAEGQAREGARVPRTLQAAAQARSSACVETLDAAPRRERDQAVVRPPVPGRWLAAPQAVLLRGARGTGRPPPRRAEASAVGCSRPQRERPEPAQGLEGQSREREDRHRRRPRGQEPAGAGLARLPRGSGARMSHPIATRRDPAGPFRGAQRGRFQTRLPAPLAGADRAGGPAHSQ